jgi:peptidylprolyl isomerase
MKLSRTLLLFSIAPLALPMAAQTTAPAKPAVHHSATAAPASAATAKTGCAKVPQLSPKIPALPAGAPCAKTLYTITTVPAGKLENVSPMEWPNLREELNLEPVSFSINYVDVKVGTGELAAPHKWYSVHYSGYLVDGTKFDSSYDHPDHAPISIQIGAHGVIPGWDTGFAGMRVGGKRRLFIPFQLGYGTSPYPPNSPPVIPGRSELIFDIEFVAQSDKQPPPPPPPPAPAAPQAPANSPSSATPPATSAPAATPAPATSAPAPASSSPAPSGPAGSSAPPASSAPTTPPKPQ